MSIVFCGSIFIQLTVLNWNTILQSDSGQLHVFPQLLSGGYIMYYHNTLIHQFMLWSWTFNILSWFLKNLDSWKFLWCMATVLTNAWSISIIPAPYRTILSPQVLHESFCASFLLLPSLWQRHLLCHIILKGFDFIATFLLGCMKSKRKWGCLYCIVLVWYSGF